MALPQVHAFAASQMLWDPIDMNQRRRELFDYRTIRNVPLTMILPCHMAVCQILHTLYKIDSSAIPSSTDPRPAALFPQP